MAIQNASDVPPKLSEAKAREIIEANMARHRKLSQEQASVVARIEQAEATVASLKAKAKESLGTDDPLEIQRILDERMATNAQRVREFLNGLAQSEEALKRLNAAAPTK